MRHCLICQKPLKWVKFKSLDGYVCKECYEIVSLSFSQTIVQKSKDELNEIYEERLRSHSSKEFEATRSINQLILFDDKNQELCLPNHSKYTQQVLEPEYFKFSEVTQYTIKTRKQQREIDKKMKTVGTIEILLTFNHSISRSIWLIPKQIQIDSIPYKTMLSLAKKVIYELDSTKGDEKNVGTT